VVTVAIDTLGYMKYLENHGVPRAEAEAHAEAVNQFLFPQLATKGDVRESEQRLTIRLGSLIIAVAGLALAIAKLA
jgi:hypothetical protein